MCVCMRVCFYSDCNQELTEPVSHQVQCFPSAAYVLSPAPCLLLAVSMVTGETTMTNRRDHHISRTIPAHHRVTGDGTSRADRTGTLWSKYCTGDVNKYMTQQINTGPD